LRTAPSRPDELRERAVRMVFEIREWTGQRKGAMAGVAEQLGITGRLVSVDRVCNSDDQVNGTPGAFGA
jgi:transposase-like protein